MPDVPVVCVFGIENLRLQSAQCPHFETRDMDCRCYSDDRDLYAVLAEDKPCAIASFGDLSRFPVLNDAPSFVREKWLHYDSPQDIEAIGQSVFECVLLNMVRRESQVPLVTVFTPAFKTGDKIWRPYYSLKAQTHKEWEWVVVDDSDDNGETFKMLQNVARDDVRVRVYKSSGHSGVIGNVKREACDLGRGEFLLELDHDDELTPEAIGKMVKTYRKYPDVGFVYSDFAECFEDGREWRYANGWGMGYGSYRDETHNGMKYSVVNSPRINAKTIRHIVASPNHFRSWRKTVYDSIGGHSPLIHVADDYELMVRTFLATRMALLPEMSYVQYRNESGNASRQRNRDIQRLVRYFSMYYDKAIHNRLIDLGVDDFVWKEGMPSFYRLQSVSNPVPESHCTIIARDL